MDKPRFNFAVLAALVALALALGIANNFRVYEEQRVPWFGAPHGEESDG